MKIRTDFVTNSSSSCFCVTLTLQFDNDKDKTLCLSLRERNGDPDYYDDCGRSLYGGIGRWNYMQNFSRMIEYRDDKEKLFDALEYLCDKNGKRNAYTVWDAEKLTKAEMRIRGCASGEYMSYTNVYRLLEMHIPRDQKPGTLEKEIEYLKENPAYSIYSDDAIETIVLYNDADTGEKYKSIGEKRGIHYGESDQSKEIVARMNKDGKLDIEIEYGADYYPGNIPHVSNEYTDMSNMKYYELKLKQLDWELQKVREKKAALQAKMQGQ